MQVDGEARRGEGLEALGQERRDHARQDIAGAGRCHAGISGPVDREAIPIHHKGPMALQDQDSAAGPDEALGGLEPLLVPLGPLSGQTLELARVGGPDAVPPEGEVVLRVQGCNVDPIGIEDNGPWRFSRTHQAKSRLLVVPIPGPRRTAW